MMRILQNWISKNKVTIITTFVAAVIGWLYWYFIGCATGVCAITSTWYKTMLFFSIIGLLIGNHMNKD